MQTNTVVTNAINAANAERRKNAEDTVKYIIGNIEAEQKAIAAHRAQIECHQKQLVAIKDDVLTEVRVMGPTPGDTTPNTDTIAKVVSQINEERQKLVASRSKIQVDAISSYEAAIAACDKRIADYRKQINDIKVVEVTETQILG